MADSPNRYVVGALVRLYAEFRDLDANDVAPSTITCRVKAPDGTTTTPAVTLDALGRYHAEVSITAAGTFYYRFEGTGAAQAAEERTFVVAPTAF